MDNTYSSKNNNNNNVTKRLKIILLTTILSFGAITNIYSLSSSSSNFAFLKDVEALENQEYVLGLDNNNKKNKENKYYKDSNSDHSEYLSSLTSESESDLSPMKLDGNNYYDYNHEDDDSYTKSVKKYSERYNSIAPSIEKDDKECNNINFNVNVKGDSTLD